MDTETPKAPPRIRKSNSLSLHASNSLQTISHAKPQPPPIPERPWNVIKNSAEFSTEDKRLKEKLPSWFREWEKKLIDNSELESASIQLRKELLESTQQFDKLKADNQKLRDQNLKLCRQNLSLCRSTESLQSKLEEAQKFYYEYIIQEQERLHKIANLQKEVTALRIDNKKHREQAQTNTECLVCCDKPRSMAINPCGHFCLCRECSTGIGNNCPICRDKVISFLPVYFS